MVSNSQKQEMDQRYSLFWSTVRGNYKEILMRRRYDVNFWLNRFKFVLKQKILRHKKQLGNCDIQSGTNYSVLNKRNQNE